PSRVEEHEQPDQRFAFASLQCYDGLDQELQQETGIDIEFIDAPTLRPALDEQDVARLQLLQRTYQHLLPGLQWLERSVAREIEPLLPETALGALLSPRERSVQVTRLTLAFARGAVLRGADLFEGRPVERLIRQGRRVVGVETTQGPVHADATVLAAGAWMARWHAPTAAPPLFPVKGQIMAVQLPSTQILRHSFQAVDVGVIIPKVDGSIYVGATIEHAGFDKTVTADGLSKLLAILEKLAPALRGARFLRAWTGLRPGSADGIPLIGPCQSVQGLWVAGGHFRHGILLGPLTGQVLAELLQGRSAPYDLDLAPFNPDRFGGWDRAATS
ncbi:MAG TPA: FAD-dependent oxidoreductase, partial [Ktedonobacteraceae bacterium]